MNFINNITNNEFKFLTDLIFNEGSNKKDACDNKYIQIPKSVTSVGYCAFSNCTSLKSIIIPNSVTSIGCCTFSNCTSLKKITIPTKFKNSKFLNFDLSEVIIIYT